MLQVIGGIEIDFLFYYSDTAPAPPPLLSLSPMSRNTVTALLALSKLTTVEDQLLKTHSSHVSRLETALTDERARRQRAESGLERATSCVICWERPLTRCLQPCKHLVLCDQCDVTRCPVCRKNVQKRLRVILP